MRRDGLTITFDEPARPPARQEYASNSTDIFLNNFVFGGPSGSIYPQPDEILRIESRGKYYDLYEHMEDTDPHYFAVLDTRKNAILGKPWVITPSDRDPRGEEHAEFIKIALSLIPQFDDCMYELLDAMGKGWKCLEIMWDTMPVVMNDGTTDLKVIVKELKGRPQRRFVFDMNGTLLLLRPEEQFSQGVSIWGGEKGIGQPLPARKFVVAQFNKKDDNPYGKGLAKKVYWYYWFKKSLIKYAMVFADKFGMPTAVGKYTPGLTQEKVDALINMLRNLQQDSVCAFPSDTEVSLLEAQRSGTVQIYKDLTDFFDDAVSKAVLGQTLSSNEGRRSGSLALGEVHADVKQDVLEKDAKWFAGVLNSQLIRWMIDFNYDGVIDYPKMTFQVNKVEGQSDRATTLSTLKNLGMDLAKHQVRDEFTLDEPFDAEDVIPGGFGVTGEQPFDVGEPPTEGGQGGGATSPGEQSGGGKRPPQGGQEKGTGTKQFAEGDDDPLDAMLPGAISSGINALLPVRKEIEKSIRRRGLRRAKNVLTSSVERTLSGFHAGTHKMMFKAYQAGRTTIRQKAGKTFAEQPIDDTEINKLITTAARSIAKQQKQHVVKVVTSAINEAIRAGETDQQFLTRLNTVFDAAGITMKNPARVRTVFETSMATAYNAGVMTELKEMGDIFPDWIYFTRDDGRVRPNHQLMHRFVAGNDDPIWDKIFPPNGYNCRCAVTGLTAEEADSIRGVRYTLPAGAGPDKGFKGNPIRYLRRL